MPALAALAVRLDVPEPPVMLVGETDALRPAEGAVVRVTVPVNPPTGLTVIVEVPEAPALSGPTVVGLELMVKSGDEDADTVTVTLAVLDAEPLVPVTVTVYAPEEVPLIAENVRVELPELPAVSVTLFGLTETMGPPGDTLAARFTVPAKLLTLVTAIVDVPDAPWLTVRDVGLGLILKP